MAETVSAEDRRKKQALQRERKDALRREMLKTMPHGKLSIEIGVWRGEFSRILLDELKPSKLCLIDPWGVQPDADRIDIPEMEPVSIFTCRSTT